MSFIWNKKKKNTGSTLHPSICKCCVCANMQCGQVTIMNQRAWRTNRQISQSYNICFSSLLSSFFIFYFPFFFFFKPLLFFELMHQKVSLRLQDVLSLCLWSSANILPPRLFPSQKPQLFRSVRWPCCRLQDVPFWLFIGVYAQCVCLWQREKVCFPPGDFDVSCFIKQNVPRGGAGIMF